MKKIRLIIFIVLFIPMGACTYAQTPQKLLTKKWVFKEVDKKEVDDKIALQMEQHKKEFEGVTDSVEKANKKADIKKQTELEVDQINEMFRNLTFEFKLDGTCETGGRKDKKIEKGKWTLSKDGKKIFITSDKNKQEFDITKLTPDELTIGMPTGSGSIYMNFSRSKTPKEMIAQKWFFKEIDQRTLDTVIAKASKKQEHIIDSAERAAAILKAQAEFAEKIKNFKDMTLLFKADGTYETTGFKADKGKWELSEDSKQLIIIDERKTNVLQIVKLTANELFIMISGIDIEAGVIFYSKK